MHGIYKIALACGNTESGVMLGRNAVKASNGSANVLSEAYVKVCRGKGGRMSINNWRKKSDEVRKSLFTDVQADFTRVILL